MEEQIATKDFTPPYGVSFRTFLNLLQRMEEEGMPPRIDRSYLRSLSGHAQTYLMAALRSFGLIEENGNVTDELDRLVHMPDDRARLLGELLGKYYPEAVEHGEMNGTPKQLEEVFANRFSIAGNTLRKAITFYLHAAEFANLPISRYMRLRQAGPRRVSTGRKVAIRPKVDETTPPAEQKLSAELRAEYIKKLMERALADGEPNAELLNRIERLLGYTEESEPVTE